MSFKDDNILKSLRKTIKIIVSCMIEMPVKEMVVCSSYSDI